MLKTEQQFLKEYDASAFERPNTTIDTVIFTVFEQSLHVLIIKRSEFPFKDVWSLVGGYIDIAHDKSLEETAKRKLNEKTGVNTPYLEQFETIGNATRDPRGWTVTTVYFALLPFNQIQLKPGSDTTDIKWSKIENNTIKDSLAFDHTDILNRCILRLRSKVLYTSLPVYLMSEEFTLGELQSVYEIILGQNIDHKSFRRRVLSVNLLEESDGMRHNSKRPAQLYRLKKMDMPHYFMRNIECAG